MRGLIVSRGLTPVSEMVSPLWGAYRSPQMRLGVLGDRFVQTSGRRTPPVYAAACPPRGRAAAGTCRSGARASRWSSVPSQCARLVPVTVGAFAALRDTACHLDEVTAGNGPGNRNDPV